MNEIAIGISCWNRPHYFGQLISTLEANLLDLEDVDIHLFVDGDICTFTGERRTERKPIRENIDIFQKAILPNKFLHIRTLNVGTAIHQHQMMLMLTQMYEKIVFLEDDVVVSPNFVSIMKNILEQYQNDKELFSVSPGMRLLCDEKEVDKYRDAIKLTEGHFWAEAMWTSKWNKILPKLQKYIDIVKEKDYYSRDNQRINELFQKHGRKMPTTSQDNAKDWAISQSGMKRGRLVVNRATGIGDVGIHSTKSKLEKSGDGHNKIHVFDDDKTIKFRVL